MSLRLLCFAIVSLVIALPARSMSSKPPITVRFHSEANANDGDAFATPVNLIYQKRQVYLSRVADISEKHISKILPFPARDGSWGCVFKLNPQGRLRLETMSGEIRGSTLVVFIATKSGQHQVADMVIDRPVTDGIISIPRGLTTLEIVALKKEFKTIGEEEKKGWRDRPRLKTELPGGPGKPAPDRSSVNEPITSAMPSRRRGSAEPDLPRLAD